MDYFEIIFLCFAFALGAILGSFACCQARRLHAREEAPGPKTPSKSPSKNSSSKTPSGKSARKPSSYGRRSICEHCKRQLSWYENIPIFSWLFLKGRCKKCHEKIGLTELFSEFGLGLATLFLSLKFWPALSAASGPLPFISFALLIVIFTGLTICFVYDALWGHFPSFVLYILIALSAVFLALEYLSGSHIELLSLLAGIGILPGLYYILYIFSREKLVGSGDWLLCLPFALILHNFWLCFFVLFLANILAVFVQLPITSLSKKKSHQFPFGPFLIIAFIVIYLCSFYVGMLCKAAGVAD